MGWQQGRLPTIAYSAIRIPSKNKPTHHPRGGGRNLKGNALCAVNLDSGESRQIVEFPNHISAMPATINADNVNTRFIHEDRFSKLSQFIRRGSRL